MDISSKVGWCASTSGGNVLTGKIHFPKIGNSTTDQMKRLDKYRDKFHALIGRVQPDIIAIEGYAYATKNSSELITAIGTIARLCCLDEKVVFIEIPPTSLKRLVTGKGNCPKSLIIKEVFKRWGFDTDDDDIADAYSLVKMTKALLGEELDLPKGNLEALTKVALSQKFELDTIRRGVR